MQVDTEPTQQQQSSEAQAPPALVALAPHSCVRHAYAYRNSFPACLHFYTLALLGEGSIIHNRNVAERIIQIWECSAGGRRWVGATSKTVLKLNAYVSGCINACMGGNGMMRVGRRGKLI